MSAEHADQEESELHEAVAGLGNWHKVGNQNQYLANKEECLSCLEALTSCLKVDKGERHLPKHLKLGEWKVLPNHLVPLFAAYRQDPDITHLALEVLVQLTTHVDQLADDLLRHLEHLQDYKEAFAGQDAFIIVMGMLVSSMDIDDEEEAGKEDTDARANRKRTFESLLKLLCNLISVPDPCPGDAGFTPSRKVLQQIFIKHFNDEGALEFLLLYAEQVEQEHRPEQAWLFLDIIYHICAQVNPAKVACAEEKQKGVAKFTEFLDQSRATKRLWQPTRHSRFGTRMQQFDAVGGMSITHSVLQSGAVSKGRRVAGRDFKDRQDRAQARKQNMFHDPFFVDLEEGAVRDHNQLNPHVRNGLDLARDYSSDVLEGLRKFFEDFTQSCFSSLVNLLRNTVTQAQRQAGGKSVENGGVHGCQRLLNFVAWVLEFHRHAYYAQVTQAAKTGATKPRLDVVAVQGALDLDMIQFVTGKLREYGKKENIHASYLVIVLRLLAQQVKTIMALFETESSELRDIAVALVQSIVKDDVMANLAWILKNFKTTVHDPRVLSYSIELYHNIIDLMQKVVEKEGKVLEFQVEKTHGTKILRGATTADKEISRLNDARVVENMFYLLEKYKRHTSKLHSMLTKLLFAIIKQQPTNIVVFFELGYFVRIHRMVSDPLVRDSKHGKRYQEMKDLLQYILRQFFKCAEKNHCVFVELLFRKVHENPKDALLENSNAEFTAILEDYETEEYRHVLERMREGETMKAMKARQRLTMEGCLPWTDEEDAILRDDYASLAEHPLCSALLASRLPEKNSRDAKQVWKRLKELNLVQSKAERAGRERAEDPAESAMGEDAGSPAAKRRKLDEGTPAEPHSTEMEGGTLEADLEALMEEDLDDLMDEEKAPSPGEKDLGNDPDPEKDLEKDLEALLDEALQGHD